TAPPYCPPFSSSGYGAHPALHSFPTRRSSDLAEHLRLAAELAFGADFARHARDFTGERVELIDHRVDGALQLEHLALHIDRNLRSEEHTSELQSPYDLVCRLLLEKKTKLTKYP